jgi:hypothetical protein
VLGRTARLLKTRHCFAYQVGVAYKKGRGVVTNDVEALKWFLRMHHRMGYFVDNRNAYSGNQKGDWCQCKRGEA